MMPSPVVFQAHTQPSFPMINAVPIVQRVIRPVQVPHPLQQLLVSVEFCPRARRYSKKIARATRDTRRARLFPAADCRGGSAVFVLAPDDSPVVELHKGVLAVRAPPRRAVCVPKGTRQRLEHLSRRFLQGSDGVFVTDFVGLCVLIVSVCWFAETAAACMWWGAGSVAKCLRI